MFENLDVYNTPHEYYYNNRKITQVRHKFTLESDIFEPLNKCDFSDYDDSLCDLCGILLMYKLFKQKVMISSTANLTLEDLNLLQDIIVFEGYEGECVGYMMNSCQINLGNTNPTKSYIPISKPFGAGLWYLRTNKFKLTHFHILDPNIDVFYVIKYGQKFSYSEMFANYVGLKIDCKSDYHSSDNCD